jgi:hypothetical protein
MKIKGINSTIFGIIITFLLFYLSLYIRVPNINKPLGYKHEWVTAHMLTVLHGLKEYPASTHKYRLITTYRGDQNLYIGDVNSRQIDSDGIGYYTTFPPFSGIFTHFLFETLNIEISIINLQTLNILLHFLSSTIIYLIISTLTKKNTVLSILGTAIYIYLSPHLWFFSNTYSWDILWHYFWILEIYIYSKLIYSKKPSTLLLLTLFVVNSATVYTEYQGILFPIIASIALFKLNKNIFKNTITILSISTLLPILTTILQYSLIKDQQTPFFPLMIGKIFREYGTKNNIGLYSLSDLVSAYIQFIPYIWIPVFILIFVAVLKKSQHKISFEHKSILSILIIPSVIHHIVLLPDAIIHEFALLKFSIFLCILIPLLLQQTFTKPFHRLLSSIVFLIVIIPPSITHYQNYYVKSSNTSGFLDLSNQISNNSNTDEVLFAISVDYVPAQVSYYTKRNIRNVPNIQYAEQWLYWFNGAKGRVMYINDFNLIKNELVFPVNHNQEKNIIF